MTIVDPAAPWITKRCLGDCAQVKPLVAFSKGNGKYKHRTMCKPCTAEYMRRRREQDPFYIQRENLRQKYGLSLEDYWAKLDEQGGVCAICKGVPPSVASGKALFHVDHDHGCCPGKKTCGRCVRGLVCWGCNSFVAQYEGARGAATQAYLRRWGGDAQCH